MATSGINLYDHIASEITYAVQDLGLNLTSSKLDGQFFCTSSNCDGPLDQTTVNYLQADCIQLCYQTYYSPFGNEAPYYDIYEVVCGTACCKRTTPFCIDDEGNICYGTTVKENISGDCDPVTSPDCGEGNLFKKLNECSHPCNRL